MQPAQLHFICTMAKKKKKTSSGNTIAVNKRARFEYQIEERIEAGLSLQGWEVKSLRAGQIQFGDSYVLLKDNEAWLFGTLIPPLPTVSTHYIPDPTRTRKLLMHRTEINKLTSAVERQGYTVIPTAMYWSKGKVKVEVGMAKGKKQHDKRKVSKDRDWKIQQGRIMKGRH